MDPLLGRTFNAPMHARGIIFRLGFVDFLGHFKLASSDEVNAVNLGRTFHINFLTSDELLWPHILIDFFDDIRPKG